MFTEGEIITIIVYSLIGVLCTVWIVIGLVSIKGMSYYKKQQIKRRFKRYYCKIRGHRYMNLTDVTCMRCEEQTREFNVKSIILFESKK